MAQDTLQNALELYKDARDAMRDNHARMREDMEFSNPADPQQWPEAMRIARGTRPTLTMDHTNQYINQVTNDGRQNTPSIQTMPVDSKADPIVAERMNGMLRHIEYVSRAGIAYDTGLENSARVGLGWLRALPQVLNEETGEQEIRIAGVHDPMAALIDGDSVEPDGSDATVGFVETIVAESRFKEMYPKASTKDANFGESNGWFTGKGVKLAEMMKVVEEPTGRSFVVDFEGTRETITESEFEQMKEITGQTPKVIREFKTTKRKVKWIKMTGNEVLEETWFPSRWVGLVPVYGHVIWIEGRRYICGMTRRMRDGQMFHNWQMSALAEQNLSQPKAPFLVPVRAIEGHEHHWQQMNSGNPSYLPYNDYDPDAPESAPITQPARLAPPAFPAAYANGARLGSEEMQASVGMYKSNLGMNSSSVSGRAKMQDKIEGDTANFHYIDNLRRSMEHLGRIIVDMMPAVYDTARKVRILGLDRKEVSFVALDPDLDEAVKRGPNREVEAINLGVGTYDVRVVVGPGYTSQRSELAERLTAMSQGNPQLALALSPLQIQMADLPDAEKVMRIVLSMLPPEARQAYEQGDADSEIPPAVRQQMEGQQRQLQEAMQMVQQLSQALDQANQASQTEQMKLQQQAQMDAIKAQTDLLNAQSNAKKADADVFRAQTDRMKVEEELEQAELDAAVRLVKGGETAEQTGAQIEQVGADVAALTAQQMQVAEAMLQMAAQQQESTQQAIAAMAQMAAQPRVVQVQRDPITGRIAGAVAVTPTEAIQ